MKIVNTSIDGLLVLEPKIFGDSRGAFFESYNEQIFSDAVGEKISFVQDNQSTSSKGVLRGLHFQNPPNAQGKLVRVVQGSVLDVAVDIRKDSPTYGQHISIELSAENNKQFWIPPGFAHGFIALEDDTIFLYKCTDFYAPQSEGTIIWNDPELNIDWRISPTSISEKDQKGIEFSKFDSQFT